MITGYEKPLDILPFDHRHSYITGVFHWQEPLTPDQVEAIVASKQVIYDGFKAAAVDPAVRDRAGILVDEAFGAALLRDAAAHRYITCVSTEKSGQDEFDFEYGEAFAQHLESVNPTFAKVLVRYNPDGDRTMNARQVERLRRLSNYLAETKRLFMFELLVPPERAQLERLAGSREAYDRELRPTLMIETIHALQDAGVEPDVWKIEDSIVARIARRSSKRHVAPVGPRSAASFSAEGRTSKPWCGGSRSRQASRASSVSRSVGRRGWMP